MRNISYVIEIPANGYLLVVKNLEAFNESYTPESGTLILGPYVGKLSNGGEKLELAKPGDQLDGVRHYIRMDRVNYGDQLPWPTEPDGSGSSLLRIAPGVYGNDAVNWQAASPTPG